MNNENVVNVPGLIITKSIPFMRTFVIAGRSYYTIAKLNGYCFF